MADKSGIEWTDASWTAIRARNLDNGKVGWHCEHVTTGCEFCYSENMNKWRGTGLPFKPGHRKHVEIFLDEKVLLQPLRWSKPRMIFVCSMTDLFADFVKDRDIERMFAVMALCPQHKFQVLTKRADRMREFLSSPSRHNAIELAAESIQRGPAWLGGKHILPKVPFPNVWLGVSAERQQEADERIPLLLQTPAAIRFASCEPLLGSIDLVSTKGGTLWLGGQRGCGGMHRGNGSPECPRELHHHHDERCGPGLDWVIVGGESGAHARPMHPDWARSLRDQCAAARVAYFFKQWGNWHPEIDRDRDDPDWRQPYPNYRWPHFRILNLAGGQGFHGDRVHVMRACSKKSAGRLLDGLEYNELPRITA